MVVHIEQRSCKQFHIIKPGVKKLAVFNLIYQRVRDNFTGFVILSIYFQYLRLGCPMLHYLWRKLNYILCSVCCAVFIYGEQRLKSMSEFMEKSSYIINAEQWRNVIGRIVEVTNNRHNRVDLLPVEPFMIAIFSAPCSLNFACSGEEIHVKNAQGAPIGFLNLKCLCVGMGKRNCSNRRKCNSI